MLRLVFTRRNLANVQMITDSLRCSHCKDGYAFTMGGLEVKLENGEARLVKGGKSERVCASYTLEDDDLYVRARIESDAPGVYGQKRKLHPYTCTAWTQPYGH
jgi:hypothetical protein